jgi:hypothetical protein
LEAGAVSEAGERAAQVTVSTSRAATTHNARHERAADSQILFASVPNVSGSLIVKSRDLSGRFDEGGGSKNRCRFWDKKSDQPSLDFTYT